MLLIGHVPFFSGPDARLSIEQSIPNLADTMDAQAVWAGLQYLDYLGWRVPR